MPNPPKFDPFLGKIVESDDTSADLTGVAGGASDLGTFTGTTISDNVDIKTALQELETATEAVSGGEVTATLTGVAAGANDLGTFTGTTITDNVDIKTALQELETGVEAATGETTFHVSANDTTDGYAEDKIVSSSGLTRTVLNEGANEQLQFKLSSDYLAQASSGVFDGAVLSVGVSTGTFDIAQGNGIVIDSTTDFNNVEVTHVTITARTNVAVTNIATQPVTYILIDKNDNIIQNTNFPTPEEKRNNIFIGVVVHSDNVNVLTVNNLPSVSLDVSAQLHDLFDGLGFFNESGNVISPNGANLSFDKSAGSAFKAGANFANNSKDPHTLTLAGQTAAIFRYRTQTSVEGSNVTVIDPTSYDLNGTVTTITGSTNQATLQRIYVFPSNIIRVQYGQQVYPTLSDAVEAVGKEQFVTEPNLSENGLLLATLAVTVDCTDLTNTSRALLFSAGRFGELGSVGSSAIGTLQQTYNNSIANPEILTNDTNQSVAFRRGTTGGDSDIVLEVQNNAGTVTFSVDGNGSVATSGTVDGRDIAADGTQLDTNTTDISNLQNTAIVESGTNPFTGNQSMGSNRLTDLAAPVGDNDAARKSDVDAAASGMLPKDPVRVASTADVGGSYLTGTISGLGAALNIDGVALATNDRVLLKDQTDAKQNGIYVYDGVDELNRSTDMDGTPSNEVKGGNSTFVNEGSTHADNMFRLDGTGELTLDVNDLNWIFFSRVEALTVSSGLTKTGLDIQMSNEYLATSSTGVLEGGVLSVGTPNTTFSISDGKGIVIDETDFDNPVITPVSWTGQTNLAVTFLATNLITFVGINSAGTIIQQTSRFTPAQRRSIIVLGVLVHVDKTIVDAVNNEQVTGLAPVSQLYDFMESINFFNVNGNQFSPNVAANLQFDKSSGNIFKAGSNYDTSPVTAPHVRPIGAFTPVNFQYRFQDGSNVNPTTALETAIDPSIYDDGNGAATPGTVPSNRFTIQRVYIFTSGNVKIQPGQTLYNSLAAAKEGLQTEAFNTEPSIAANGLLRAFIIVKGDATDLTDSGQAGFFDAGKFGETSIAGGLSVSTLQGTYNNSASNPEIETTDPNGAVTLRRGTTGGDTDTVLEVQNNAGTSNFSVAGDGFVDHEVRQRTLNTASPSAVQKIDGTLLFDTTSTAITVDLPAASIGKVQIPFKDIGANAGTNNITMNRVGADTIVTSSTGQTSVVINVNGDSGYLLSNGVDTWYLFGAYQNLA